MYVYVFTRLCPLGLIRLHELVAPRVEIDKVEDHMTGAWQEIARDGDPHELIRAQEGEVSDGVVIEERPVGGGIESVVAQGRRHAAGLDDVREVDMVVPILEHGGVQSGVSDLGGDVEDAGGGHFGPSSDKLGEGGGKMA